MIASTYTIFSITDYEAFDKSFWTSKLIWAWNRKKGTIQNIPRASGRVSTAYLKTKEQEAEDERRKNYRKKPLIAQDHLDWDEVPTRLPYLFGRNDPNSKLDPTKVYVDSTFLEMAEKAQSR